MSVIDSQLRSSSGNVVELRIRDLGRMAYEPAWTLQRQIHQQVIEARESTAPFMELLLVEHDPPVITISRRPGARKHLLASDERLQASGVEVCETDRGGDITYHGPGQLVAYPILDLNRINLRMVSYLRFLEDVILQTLAEFGLAGQRDPEATGVWVQSHKKSESAARTPLQSTTASKICAIGVRVSRWVTMHGLALNVTTNLDHFNLIVPCGLAGRGVTSMQRELAEGCPSMHEVKSVLAGKFKQALGCA